MDPGVERSRQSMGDLVYDALYVAGIGGGIVAMFFLVLDVMRRGQALFTPALMGSVLFEGASAASLDTVSMTAVAKYSVVHLAGFGLMGWFLAYVTHQANLRARHPLLVILIVFLILEIAFWAAATLAFPGVLQRLGVVPVAAANLLAAAGVGLFLVSTHRRRS